MIKIFKSVLVICVLLLNSLNCVAQNNVETVSLPDKAPIILSPVNRISFKPINESSGLVKSRTFPDVFWTHNDSGDKARIFAIRQDGSIIKSKNAQDNYDGINISQAENVDWEDIAVDNDGNLIIADFGNNNNRRKDLTIYFVKEPNPFEQATATAFKKVRFFYADQDSFPPTKKNFDSEAIFWARGKLYLLTKHRSDTFTKLYRFDSMATGVINPLKPISRFETKFMVTAADVSPDGNKLVVLTYDAIWMFEVSDSSDDYFGGKISWLPIFAKQCEGICFTGTEIIICNEQRDLFKLSVDQLILVRDKKN